MTDTLIRVASPEGIAFDLNPAGALVRIAAYLIDLLLQGVAFYIIVIVLVIFKIAGNWTISLAGFVIIWFYMVIFELLCGSRSLGKMIMGLQVVLSDGSPITIQGSLLRNLLRAFDFFFGIGLLVPLFNTGFRRLGDIVANTLVVYIPKPRFHGKFDFTGIEPRVPERILGPEAADVILSYAQRSKSFSPELRRELALSAVGVYLLDSASAEEFGSDEGNPSNEGDAEKSAMQIAAWYAGIRPSRKTGAV